MQTLSAMGQLYILIALLAFNFFGFDGQDVGSHIIERIDSLDRIHPVALHSIKPIGRPYVIHVKNQQQFDGMNEAICKAIQGGKKNIIIKISRGVYLFYENHISFSKVQNDDVSVTIEGNNAIITSETENSHQTINHSPWQELIYADSVIELVDLYQKLCKIPYRNDIVDSEKGNYGKVQITQWFRAPIYDIIDIDERGIYFIAPNVKYIEQFGRKGYNVNYDYLYGGKIPRFRLYDRQLERQYNAATFIKLGSCTFRSFTIKGLHFRGNKGDSALLILGHVNAKQLLIVGCAFENIQGNVVSASRTDNVVFDHNNLKDTEGNELYFTNGCRNVRITRNVFEDCNQGLTNSMCIRCNEGDYYIADNTIRDFGYSAIGVGLWYGSNKVYETRSIVEHNEIYYTSEYFKNKEKYTLMDGGAIYVWTLNDDAIIRYNYIHDYCGMEFYSGIYCDDGASNVNIYGNVIINTPDGYSIHSRMVKDLKEGFRNNANNLVANNVIDGSVVFEGYGVEERHNWKGTNIVLWKICPNKNRFNGLEMEEKDLRVEDWAYDKYKLFLPQSVKQIVYRKLDDKRIKKIVK